MPWQHMVNFKFAQDFYININGKRNTITLGVDINNLANLINRNWCGIDRLESSQILKYNTKTNAYNFTKPAWSKYAEHGCDLVGDVQHPLHASTKSPGRGCNARKRPVFTGLSLFVYTQSDCYSSLPAQGVARGGGIRGGRRR